MKDSSSNKEYREYLEKISFKAKLYRNLFYFPKLNKYLSGNILEVGCGIGGFLSFNKSVTGVDINSELVEICKNKKLNAHLMDFDILPFKTNLFDSVLLDNVLEHIENPIKIITEIHRVLKRNGLILISVPGEKGFAHDKDHVSFYNKSSLKLLLHDNGFNLVKFFNTPFSSKYLDRNMRQYCLHGLFHKNEI